MAFDLRPFWSMSGPPCSKTLPMVNKCSVTDATVGCYGIDDDDNNDADDGDDDDVNDDGDGDNEAVFCFAPPKGSIPVTGAWTNWATSPATGNCSITITNSDGTLYSLISPRHSDCLERLPLCATFVTVTTLAH